MDLFHATERQIIEFALLLGRHEKDAGRVMIDEGQRPMLEETGRPSLSMEIGDLFHLECRLKRNGRVHPATKEKPILIMVIATRQLTDMLLLGLEHSGEQFGEVVQLFEDVQRLYGRAVSLQPTQLSGEAEQ